MRTLPGFAFSVMLAGCGQAARTEPAAPVHGLYGALIERRVTGAPSTEQLARISPHLSTELRTLLDSARAVREAEVATHPGEKPLLSEGDLFTSLFEGPTAFDPLPGIPASDGHLVPVRFRDGRPSPPVEWTDTVVVIREAGTPVVADVRYGGTWDFANRGSLRTSLRLALRPDGFANWVLEMQGIGPIRIGMTVAHAAGLLGTPRIDRIEPEDACGYAWFPRAPEGVSFMLAGDTLVRTNVDTTGFRTATGVGVGSRETEVLAAYAGMVRVEPHPYTGPEGHYLIVDDPAVSGFRMIFETDGTVVTSLRAGRLPEVDLIEGCA